MKDELKQFKKKKIKLVMRLIKKNLKDIIKKKKLIMMKHMF